MADFLRLRVQRVILETIKELEGSTPWIGYGALMMELKKRGVRMENAFQEFRYLREKGLVETVDFEIPWEDRNEVVSCRLTCRGLDKLDEGFGF